MQKKPEPVTMGADATVYIWFICQVIYRYIFSIRGTLGFYAKIHVDCFWPSEQTTIDWILHRHCGVLQKNEEKNHPSSVFSVFCR